MERKGRQAERSAATTRALLRAARTLFGESGYAKVSLNDIVTRAGVTKGAVYHHFHGKREILRAVVAEIEAELLSDILARIAGIDDPLEQLRVGFIAFLDRCLDRNARRIALLDAPAVLGWEESRAIDAEHGLGLMIELLESGMKRGGIRRQPARPLAHLILGAAIEAGMLIAHAPDAEAEREQVEIPLMAWLESLGR